MKITMNLLVRNEEDILEYNILHHRKIGIDHINIMNHLSTDKTEDIINFYAKDGFVTHIKQNSDRYDQDIWMTELTNNAYRDGCDWIINADADEFFNTTIPLKQILSNIDTDVVSVKYMDSIQSINDDFKNSNRFSQHGTSKIIVRSLPNIKMNMGNHSCNISHNTTTFGYNDPIVIYHYPCRSEDQCYRKMVVGGEALKKSFPNSDIGGHWTKVNNLFYNNKEEYKKIIFQKFDENYFSNIITDNTFVELFGQYKKECVF